MTQGASPMRPADDPYGQEAYRQEPYRQEPYRQEPGGSPRSTEQLIGDLVTDVNDLVRREVTMAKEELASKGRQAGVGGGIFGLAEAFGLVALGCFAACIIAALHVALAVWLSALLIGAMFALMAGVFAMLARTELKRAAPFVPETTISEARTGVQQSRRRAA